MLFVIFSLSVFANSFISYNFYTKHIDEESLFENNRVLSFEYEINGNSTVFFSYFKNSFQDESCAIAYRIYGFPEERKKIFFTTSLGFVEGYKKNTPYGKFIYTNDFVFYKKLGLLMTFGCGFSFSERFSTTFDLFGNAIIVVLRYKIN